MSPSPFAGAYIRDGAILFGRRRAAGVKVTVAPNLNQVFFLSLDG